MTAILLEHFHGAVTRIGRRKPQCPIATGLEPLHPVGVDGPGRTEPNSPGRARRTAPSAASRERRWLNYLGDDQGDDAIRAAYGPNYARLREVKRRYDPEQRLPPQPQHQAGLKRRPPAGAGRPRRGSCSKRSRTRRVAQGQRHVGSRWRGADG